MIGFGFKWKQNTATPKLVALTVNGIPYTCIEGDITSDTSDTSSNLPPPDVEAVVAEEDEVRPSRPSGSTTIAPEVATQEAVVLPQNTNSERGVFVPWPKKVIHLINIQIDFRQLIQNLIC